MHLIRGLTIAALALLANHSLPAQELKPVRSLPIPAGDVSDLMFAADGQTLYVASRDFIRAWNLETGKNVLEVRTDKRRVAIAADAQSYFYMDGGICRADMTTGKLLRRSPAYSKAEIEVGLQLSPNRDLVVGRYLVDDNGRDADTLVGWNLELQQQFELHFDIRIAADFQVLPKSYQIVAAGNEGGLFVYDWKSGKRAFVIADGKNDDGRHRSHAVSPDETTVISQAHNLPVDLFSLEHKCALGQLQQQSAGCAAVSIFPGNQFAVCRADSYSGKQVIWNLKTKQAVALLVARSAGATATSSDGRYYAIADPRGAVTVWDISRFSTKPRAPSGPNVAALRTWTSADGKYSTRASLLRISGQKVVLRKADGKEVQVPLASLSERDRKYIESTK